VKVIRLSSVLLSNVKQAAPKHASYLASPPTIFPQDHANLITHPLDKNSFSLS